MKRIKRQDFYLLHLQVLPSYHKTRQFSHLEQENLIFKNLTTLCVFHKIKTEAYGGHGELSALLTKNDTEAYGGHGELSAILTKNDKEAYGGHVSPSDNPSREE